MWNKKGVSLYIAITIMAILLASVLGIGGILVSQIKTMRGVENSVIAFYAADTGIEKVLAIIYDAIKNDTENSLSSSYSSTSGEFSSEASYDVNIAVCSSEDEACNFYTIPPDVPPECAVSESPPSDIPPDPSCQAPRYCIKSKGTFRGAKRAIEVNYGQERNVPGKYEFYEEDGTSQVEVLYADRWRAQTFTIGLADHIVNNVALYLMRQTGSFPGDLVVSIRNVDGSGTPTGSDLCSGSRDFNSVPENTPGWYGIDLSICNLSANTQYAIVARAPNALDDIAEGIFWHANTAAGYLDGLLYASSNSGVNWFEKATAMDGLFQTWLCL